MALTLANTFGTKDVVYPLSLFSTRGVMRRVIEAVKTIITRSHSLFATFHHCDPDIKDLSHGIVRIQYPLFHLCIGDIFVLSFQVKTFLEQAGIVNGFFPWQLDPKGFSMTIIIRELQFLPFITGRERGKQDIPKLFQHPHPSSSLHVFDTFREDFEAAINVMKTMYNTDNVIPTHDVYTGLIREYVVDGATTVWPCQIADETIRQTVFPGHEQLSYPVGQELVAMGCCSPQDLIYVHAPEFTMNDINHALDWNPDVLAVVAGCGSRKTKSSFEAFARQVGWNIISVVCTISQAINSGKTAHELGLVLDCYKLVNVGNSDDLIISLESEKKIIPAAYMGKGPFLLFLDETPLLLRKLGTSSTIQDHHGANRWLEQLIAGGEIVVVSSAHLYALLIKRITEIRPVGRRRVCFLGLNQTPRADAPVRKVVVPIRDPADWMSLVMGCQKTFFVACASRTKLEELARKLPHMFTVHQFTDDERIDMLGNNEAMSQFNVFGFTPTVGAGVSVEVPNHFKLGFLWCGIHLTTEFHLQLLQRVRNVRDDDDVTRIYAYIPPAGTYTYPTRLDLVRRQTLARTFDTEMGYTIGEPDVSFNERFLDFAVADGMDRANFERQLLLALQESEYVIESYVGPRVIGLAAIEDKAQCVKERLDVDVKLATELTHVKNEGDTQRVHLEHIRNRARTQGSDQFLSGDDKRTLHAYEVVEKTTRKMTLDSVQPADMFDFVTDHSFPQHVQRFRDYMMFELSQGGGGQLLQSTSSRVPSFEPCVRTRFAMIYTLLQYCGLNFSNNGRVVVMHHNDLIVPEGPRQWLEQYLDMFVTMYGKKWLIVSKRGKKKKNVVVVDMVDPFALPTLPNPCPLYVLHALVRIMLDKEFGLTLKHHDTGSRITFGVNSTVKNNGFNYTTSKAWQTASKNEIRIKRLSRERNRKRLYQAFIGPQNVLSNMFRHISTGGVYGEQIDQIGAAITAFKPEKRKNKRHSKAKELKKKLDANTPPEMVGSIVYRKRVKTSLLIQEKASKLRDDTVSAIGMSYDKE